LAGGQALARKPKASESPNPPPTTVLSDGRIAIPGSRTPAPPFEINVPGNYCLVGDRHCAEDGIRINADDVTIDLLGFTLAGPDSGGSVGVLLNGRKNAEIRNGTVRDFGNRGIFDKNEGDVAQGKRIIGVRVVSNGSCGVCLGGDGNLIRDCYVADNKGTGACVGRTIVEKSVFVNNTTGGIACGNYSVVLGNLVTKTEKAGIFARNGCTIKDNTVCEAGNTGIYGENGCLIEGNIASENNQVNAPWAYAGIKTVSDCIIRNNVTRGNLQNNIWVIRSGNVVEDNLATAPVDTLGNGYAFGNKSNYFANNKASGNQTDFAGEVPEGPGDGGGNLVLEHYVPPSPPSPPPSAVTPAGGAPPAGGTGGTGK
jgi:hypothetical protein